MTTVYIIAVMVVPALAWEFYTLQSGAWTISEAFRYLGQEWSLFAPYAVSVLVGHFYVQPPVEYTLAGSLSKTSEVVLVLWLGWALYVVGKALDPSLPWWGYLALCIVSMLVGAFAWTLGV